MLAPTRGLCRVLLTLSLSGTLCTLLLLRNDIHLSLLEITTKLHSNMEDGYGLFWSLMAVYL